ncbi:MAG: hypothetical protein Kow0010_17820 [Dehalococcoidia bacterium]
MIRRQIAAVREQMERQPRGLVDHVVRVAREARALAQVWDVDRDRVELAVWGHDLFRAHAPAEQLRLAEEAGVPIHELDRAYPVLLHGPVAAVVLRERFRVADEEALEAVRDHTSGSAEMSILAKVLLVADKVESQKRHGVRELDAIRELARRDLDLALLCWSDWKWYTERQSGWAMDVRHWQARSAWVVAHHAEVPGSKPEDRTMRHDDRQGTNPQWAEGHVRG